MNSLCMIIRVNRVTRNDRFRTDIIRWLFELASTFDTRCRWSFSQYLYLVRLACRVARSGYHAHPQSRANGQLPVHVRNYLMFSFRIGYHGLRSRFHEPIPALFLPLCLSLPAPTHLGTTELRTKSSLIFVQPDCYVEYVLVLGWDRSARSTPRRTQKSNNEYRTYIVCKYMYVLASILCRGHGVRSEVQTFTNDS